MLLLPHGPPPLAAIPRRDRGNAPSAPLQTSAGARGFPLAANLGNRRRLDGAQDFPPLVDATVIVEGRKASPSLLDVLWLGPA